MEIQYPAGAEAFRDQIRAFIADQLPEDWQGIGALSSEEQEAFIVQWRAALAGNNLLAVSWPEEYGGAGLSDIEQVILAEELTRAGLPDGTENDTLGIKLLGNTLITLGTDEQKSEFLPKILSGEHVWCQGFSEPEAGSDLAGLRLKAELDGDEWVINGQKTWTSSGSDANWIFAIARTDPTVAKHRGLSFLLIPMDQPGVEVRPIVNAAGYTAFNDVYFTNARTKVTNMVGSVGEGWKVANTLLGFERGIRATTDAIRFGREVEELFALAQERGVHTDPFIQKELGWCYSRVHAIRARGYRMLTQLLEGQTTPVSGSYSKAIWSQFFQKYTEVAVQILGEDALAPRGAGNAGLLTVAHVGTGNTSKRWVDEMLYGRAATIYGGSLQIQKNIIGEVGLGLPREPRLDQGAFQEITSKVS